MADASEPGEQTRISAGPRRSAASCSRLQCARGPALTSKKRSVLERWLSDLLSRRGA